MMIADLTDCSGQPATSSIASVSSSCSSSSSQCALVSVIIPVHNACEFLDEALVSVQRQKYRPLELVAFDDCSSDASLSRLESWRDAFAASGISYVIASSQQGSPRGPGFARNEAIALSSGSYLCLLDSDDYMDSDRVNEQLALALEKGRSFLIGCNFNRIPDSSTPYYTSWLNSMTDADLIAQQYRECTIICPSWFMHRSVYDNVAKIRCACGMRAFAESWDNPSVQRVPEDTIFFMDHLQLGGSLSKVARPLVTYRYSLGSWALGTRKQDLQLVRLSYLISSVLSSWSSYMIWGFGKDAKAVYGMLPDEMRTKVTAFTDVDVNKIGRVYYCKSTRRHIPVLDYRQTTSPFIVCVASKRFQGDLEKNISSLGFVEGLNYFHFC
jgi:glycosyltransferase involved in cell wall biosynthesis